MGQARKAGRSKVDLVVTAGDVTSIRLPQQGRRAGIILKGKPQNDEASKKDTMPEEAKGTGCVQTNAGFI